MLSRLSLFVLLAGLCLGQNAARKEIPLDAATLSRYVGAYQMGNDSGPVMLVTLENNQLFTKLGTQQAIPIYPESATMFFPKVVDAEIEFAKPDDKGRPATLILHQNGRDMPGERLDDAKAKALADAAVAFDKRFKDQTGAPGGEAALRKMAEDFAAGKTKSDAVSSAFGDSPQLAQVRSAMSKLGTVQSLVFKGVGPGGADIYSVRFERARWRRGSGSGSMARSRTATRVRTRGWECLPRR